MSLSLTRANLISYLRMRLNDGLVGSNTSGAYTDTELGFCIDLAYRECCVAGRTHKARKSITLTASTHTYDCADVYEPIEVSLNGSTLEAVQLGDVGVALQSWDDTADGTPVKWMQLTGGSIRIYPTPDATAAANEIVVYGYAHPTDMSTSGTPDALADAYAVSVLLDRAESEARFMRPTAGNNAQVAAIRLQNWAEWTRLMRKSTGAEK